MTRHISPLVLVLCFFIGVSNAQKEEPLEVSLIQLIATPERFDGKLVQVWGFLDFDERSFLFLHKEDHDNAMFSNAIWFDPDPRACGNFTEIDQSYVGLIGVFRMRHNFGIPGGITELRKCRLLSRPSHPVNQKEKEPRKPVPKP